ncbi:MAG: 5-formyltetrahydrofolate cyclo-ligase, partial [Mycobacterium sp.]|nr:5-formyltetrahydrofolate cyclo-ligase [Mycobacterium sp.]
MADAAKDLLRSELLAARRRVPADVRRRESRQICGHLRQVVAGARVVAAYVPLDTEPGGPELRDVLTD